MLSQGAQSIAVSLSSHPSVGAIWLAPPDRPALGSAEVHIWRIDFSTITPRLATLHASLDPSEREQSARFCYERDRTRFIVARGARRAILAQYVTTESHLLRFQTNACGKPTLVTSSADPPTFNMSHSGDIALFAVARDRMLGVDIEYIRPDVPTEQVARRFFAASEVEALNALVGNARCRAFFACWTRKEAYLKARGQGLTVPLDSFDVSVEFGEPPKLLHVAEDPEAVNRWSLVDLPVGSSYVATLAVEGSNCILHTWQWSA